MKLFHVIVPNLAVSFDLALLILLYLDMRNPMMGFIEGTPFYVVAALACVLSIISAVLLYAGYRKSQRNGTFQEKNLD